MPRGLNICLLSLDAKKAFDCLDWLFLEATMKQAGLPWGFIHKIMAVYFALTARIRINGLLSDVLNISNGTRQGVPYCPTCTYWLWSTLHMHMEELTVSLQEKYLKFIAKWGAWKYFSISNILRLYL